MQQHSMAESPHRGTNTRQPLRVALVNMPFPSTRYPSMPLGLLNAIVRERGYAVDTLDFNLHFARRLGWETYETLAYNRWHDAGEWLFGRAAFRDRAPD